MMYIISLLVICSIFLVAFFVVSTKRMKKEKAETIEDIKRMIQEIGEFGIQDVFAEEEEAPVLYEDDKVIKLGEYFTQTDVVVFHYNAELEITDYIGIPVPYEAFDSYELKVILRFCHDRSKMLHLKINE